MLDITQIVNSIPWWFQVGRLYCGSLRVDFSKGPVLDNSANLYLACGTSGWKRFHCPSEIDAADSSGHSLTKEVES